MIRTLYFRSLFFLSLASLLAVVGCGSSSGPAEADTSSETCDPTTCDEVCSPFDDSCVSCLVSAQCEGDARCHDGICLPEQSCGVDTPCETGHCDPQTGLCVACLTDHHCGGEGICIYGDCVGPAPLCGESFECPEGLVCNLSYGYCLMCGTGADCDEGWRCGPGGICLPMECTDGEARCEEEQIAQCGPNNTFLVPEPCPDGQICHMGACSESECTPNARTCEDLQIRQCNPQGTGSTLQPCPPGEYCPDGSFDCEPVRHRVLILFDTSGSMGIYPGTNVILDDCAEEGLPCPPAWPVCETANNALTVLAKSKVAFMEALAEPNVKERIDFALMRFPQSIRAYKTCRKGHYKGHNYLAGDLGAHVTPWDTNGWFNQGLAETLCVPFPSDTAVGSNFPALQQWMDFDETVVSTGVSCEEDDDCGYGYCESWSTTGKTCITHANPELRASGYTPIGKTLFYASEVYRQHVFIDGVDCSTDADCPSAGYHCSKDGLCEDAARHCRKNVILLFSDGTESANMDPNDFFHPWIQAKRMAYGLGCSTSEDCLGESTCVSGRCSVPGFESNSLVCSNTGAPCTPGESCGGNGALCVDPLPLYVEPDGLNTLKDRYGKPIRILTHAIDVDTDEAGNEWISRLGGGSHFTVSSQDPENFITTLILATDIKLAGPCVPKTE
ncbi:MAG: hypothetical protein CMH54_03210 [Myxococcales bacterium]|nr:hypothetical protein [Myxococcales bacterium]